MKTISRFIALKIVCGFLIFAFGGITFAQDDLNSGLVAYYPFNGNADDESGSGNHGTVFGASLTTDRFGSANSAYNFDGVNDYISTNYSGILGSAPRTISLWLKTTVNNKHMYGLAYGDSPSRGTSFRCGLNYVDNATEGVVIDVSNGTILYDANIDDNNWHHYVWVVPDMVDPRLTDVKVYQDGQLLTPVMYGYNEEWCQQTSINTTQHQNVHIGHFYDNEHPDFYYSGGIDDVRIYNRVLSETEIQALFTDGLLCSCPTDDCLKGCISGLVEDADTGQPLAGKLVKLKRIFPKGSGMTLMNVVTDTGGCYSFSNLDDGTYMIKVTGCKGGGKKVVVISGGSKEEGKNFQCE